MRKILLMWVIALMSVVGMAGVAQADGYEVGDAASVQGLVHFEKRYTFVPYGYCQGLAKCPQSQPYWSAVIATPTAKFEIDQVFYEGQTRAPDSVQLNGRAVKTGTILKVDATVEYASSDYYIIGSVRDVNVVMEYVDNIDIYSFPNWSCRGQLDRTTEIQVAVWFSGISGDSVTNRYGMRLIGSEETAEGRRTYSLATLNNVQATSDRENVTYQGNDVNSTVQLVVGGAGTNPNRDNLVSKLSFSLAQMPTDSTKIPASTQLDVVCNRIR